jgi:hypothetical protein
MNSGRLKKERRKMSVEQWINKNYPNIIEWAQNITKSDELSEDLAHYAIETFLTHKRLQEIIEKETADPGFGHCRGFILAIMRNSWHGAKSEFTRYYKAHRADIGHRKKNITEEEFLVRLEGIVRSDYDFQKDFMVEAITGILEEMEIDNKSLWYKGRLFKMWLDTPNFSKLSRETGIPRTSISNAVEDAKLYILSELKKRNIDYDL